MAGGIFDGGQQPDADHNPNKESQWELQGIAGDIGKAILESIAGLVELAKQALTALFQEGLGGILKLLTGGIVDIDDFLADPLGYFPRLIINLLSGGILGAGSPLNAGNIFGLLGSWLLPLIPLSHLSNEPGPNLLVEPGFDDADSISLAGSSGWVYDTTTGRTNPGCAKALAGSFLRELVSIPIEVGQDQQVTFKTWVKWAGLTYSGITPITMAAVPYTAGVRGTPVILQSLSSPALNQPSWFQLTGTYTVPAGVDQVRLQFVVTAAATAGSVWFDDAEARKLATTIPQSWIINLIPDIGGLRDFAQGLLDGFLSALRGFPFIGGTLADMLENFLGQTHTVAATAATTNQILAALGSGNPDADDFERVNPTTLGPKAWRIIQNGAGTIAIPNGHDASFVSGVTADYIAMSDVAAFGDNQSASIVLASAPAVTADIPFFPNGWGRNDIWLRCTDFSTWATRTGLRCRIDSSKIVTLSWFLNGVESVLYSGGFLLPILPTVGASFQFDAGTAALPRRFVAKLGGSPIMDFTESGTVSQFGPLYRKRCMGGRNEKTIFTLAGSGSAKQWTAEG